MAPLTAKRSAMALPMPRAAPVTRATCWERLTFIDAHHWSKRIDTREHSFFSFDRVSGSVCEPRGRVKTKGRRNHRALKRYAYPLSWFAYGGSITYRRISVSPAASSKRGEDHELLILQPAEFPQRCRLRCRLARGVSLAGNRRRPRRRKSGLGPIF